MTRCEFSDTCGYRKLCQKLIGGSVETYNDLKVIFKNDKTPQELAQQFLDYFCESNPETCRHHKDKKRLGDIVR